MIINFVLFGLAGWILEVLWTGLHSILKKDSKLICTTSLWMFPIYGLASFLSPIMKIISPLPIVLRGGIYMLCIFGTELVTGWGIVKIAGSCPWDYSKKKFNFKGLICLNYAPVWFFTGLLFEFLNNLLSKMPFSIVFK